MKNKSNHNINIALDFFRKGSFHDAKKVCLNILEKRKDDYSALQLISRICHSMGDYSEALVYINNAIKLKPENCHILYNDRGFIQQSLNLYDHALKSYKESIKIKSDFSLAYLNMGNVYNSLDDHDNAEKAYKKAIKISPNFLQAYSNLGILYESLHKLNQAEKTFKLILSIDPNYIAAYNDIANIYRAQGHFDKAENYYNKVLAINPKVASTHRMLVHLKKYTNPHDPHIDTLLNLLSGNKNDNEINIHVNFSLGKVFEDLKDYERSFEYYIKGNKAMRKTFNYDREQIKLYFKSIKKFFNKSFVQNISKIDVGKPTPIFVLGMPRSGTSLVEQILSSHKQVYGAGELTNLIDLINKSGLTGRKYPENLENVDSSSFTSIGENYIKSIRSLSHEKQYITDKMPGNFLLIGLICSIFREFKIIHCVRNPIDNCLSIYKKCFKGHLPYAYDLKDLAQYYKLYKDLMTHWKMLFPGKIYDIQYEQIVKNQREETEKLLKYCSISWDDNCMNFFETKRAVQTASSEQVRKPIYSSSINFWKKYINGLKPLINELSIRD